MRLTFRLRGVLSICGALALSACQTIDDLDPINVLQRVTLRADRSYVDRRPSGGTPLLDKSGSSRPSTFVEGTGQFVGEPPTGSLPAAGAVGEDGVTLNLVNVPASQAAKTVLGDILAVKYSIDPGIDGKITIQTPKPVTRTAALDLFQGALRSNNAALVNKGDSYKIVPLDQAAIGAAMRIERPAELDERVGSGLRIVQLKYVSASEIRRVLEPIAPKGGIVRTDDARNIITLSGSRQDVAAMMEAIALFDVDVMKGMSFALVPVKTAQPDAIATELKTIFASEREGPMGGMVQFLPNQRLGSILVISPQPQYLRRAEMWVRKLDEQAHGNEKQLYTYAVQNRPAHELVDVLQTMFVGETSGKGGANARNVAPPYQEASLQSGAGQPGSGQSSGPTSMFRSTSGFSGQGGSGAASGRGPSTPTSTGPAVSSVQIGSENGGDPRIKIVADESKNSVLIEATPDDYRRVMRMIARLDVMPKQVQIEATIAEITLNDELKFGLRWYLQKGQNSFTFSDAASGAVSSVFPGFSYALTAANMAATLNTLNSITDVNVISSPSLTVMDNRPALLQIGDQVPITTQSAISVLTTGAPVVNSVSYKDTGVILFITPRINESGRVLLDIEQEVSSVATTTSSSIDSPTIRQRRIRTTVVVNDGDGLVLGGLIQDSRNVSRSQIPLIGDIPFIGAAARYKDSQIGKTELVIMITPRVIRNLQEARNITEEYRREIELHGLRGREKMRKFETNARRILE